MLPLFLRELAGLERIVSVGMSSRLEIWDKNRWQDWRAQNQQ